MFTSEKSHVISGLFSYSSSSPTPRNPHLPSFVLSSSVFFKMAGRLRPAFVGDLGGATSLSGCPHAVGRVAGVGSSRSPHWPPADTTACDYVPGARVRMEARITGRGVEADRTFTGTKVFKVALKEFK